MRQVGQSQDIAPNGADSDLEALHVILLMLLVLHQQGAFIFCTMCVHSSFYTDMKQKYALNNKNAEYAAFGKKLHRCAERTKIARRRRDGGRLFMRGLAAKW